MLASAISAEHCEDDGAIPGRRSAAGRPGRWRSSVHFTNARYSVCGEGKVPASPVVGGAQHRAPRAGCGNRWTPLCECRCCALARRNRKMLEICCDRDRRSAAAKRTAGGNITPCWSELYNANIRPASWSRSAAIPIWSIRSARLQPRAFAQPGSRLSPCWELMPKSRSVGRRRAYLRHSLDGLPAPATGRTGPR